MADTDPLAAVLAEKRIALVGGTPDQCYEAGQALLGVAFIVAKLHREDKLYLSASDEDHPGACPHNPESDHDAHFEDDDGIWYCTSRPAGSVCRCGKEWPCEEYAAVLGALTGRNQAEVLAELTGEGNADAKG